MPKVKIASDNLETFSAAAQAAGMTVTDWLTAAAARQALLDEYARENPGSRVLCVPIEAPTVANLDKEVSRTGTPDWAYAARLLRDVVDPDSPDTDQLWADVITSISMDIRSTHQRAVLEQAWIDTIVGDTVLLVVPDAYARDVVEARLRPTLNETLSRLLTRRVQVAATIAPEGPAPTYPATGATRRPASRADTLQQAMEIIQQLQGRLDSSGSSARTVSR